MLNYAHFLGKVGTRRILYDRLGSYDLAWGSAISLGLLAAALNLQIREEAVAESIRPAT